MKKLLFIILASTVGISACASSDSSNGTSDRNHQRPAMSADMKQAMDDCAQRAGVKLTRDSRPSKNDMKKIDSCMSAKGFEKPAGQGRH
ncbi:hypothetical protein [Psychrobacter sp. DM4]|uniref:hypothetical protein n=1 Tax=Psychrobacter sp. DM4 TaxID=3440637 RepID=UPI003F4F5BAD